MSLKVVGRGVPDAPRLPDAIRLESSYRAPEGTRRAYFGETEGWIDTPVVGRTDLTATPRGGPLIIEEYDSTTVVRPGWSAAIDGWNNIVLVAESR